MCEDPTNTPMFMVLYTLWKILDTEGKVHKDFKRITFLIKQN